MSSTTSTSLSKEQKYLLNSKTWKENSGELAKLCLERCELVGEGDIKFTTMLVRKYTSFVLDWLKENWEVRDDIKEGIMKALTAEWFIEKLRRQST